MRKVSRVLGFLLISSGFGAAAFADDIGPVRGGVVSRRAVVRTSIEVSEGIPPAPMAQVAPGQPIVYTSIDVSDKISVAPVAELSAFPHPGVWAESQALAAAVTSASPQAAVSVFGLIQWQWLVAFSSNVLGEFKYYSVDVPSGVSLFGVGMTSPAAPADADLYMRYGAKPDLANFDCRPNLGPGLSETCLFAGKVRAGRWWFALRTAFPYSIAGGNLQAAAYTYQGAQYQPWDFNPGTVNPGTALVTGDTRTDIVWHSAAGGVGTNVVWPMNDAGGIIGGSGFYLNSTADPNWKVVGAGDFNGDGIPDVVVHNSVSGANQVWFQNGPTLTGYVAIDFMADTTWEIVSVADMNSDGMPDLVWRNNVSGQNAVWFMNGTSVTSSAYLPALADPAWRIAGMADFNFDGKPDIVWRNFTTGGVALWYMNEIQVTAAAYLPGLKNGLWDLAGVGDMSGDLVPDLIWRDGATGANAVWKLNTNLTIQGYQTLPSLATSWVMTGPR